ncbi:MAG: phosphoribosylformylglycinamidine cyclo-ligase [Spirochaetales bacterium]|nr:phosphoribosylformylglycinamidine cyclo-ligase [Spirochaetales bacterium]
MKNMISSYKDAGVDIEKGDRFADFIKTYASKAILNGIGAFSGGIELDVKRYKRPVLLTTTDGVGTKLLIAQRLACYTTIGIDLVAMCVNDLIVCGAEPLLFLDYIACGQIREDMLQEVMKGIIRGCEIGQVKLAGGETAEMPDMYKPGDIDLAGFAVGIAEKERILPKKNKMDEGDLVFGLPSNGIHSNGLSLARKVIPDSEKELWQDLLVPTKIYTEELKTLIPAGGVLGAAHITGGGLYGNIVRVIPVHLEPELDFNWEVPHIFEKIRTRGNIGDDEMKRVFNLGIGIALIVKKEKADILMRSAKTKKISLIKMGRLVRRKTLHR